MCLSLFDEKSDIIHSILEGTILELGHIVEFSEDAGMGGLGSEGDR